ncbi:MAG: PAS domain S-box protein [Deltaproteobacteria bacterium]
MEEQEHIASPAGTDDERHGHPHDPAEDSDRHSRPKESPSKPVTSAGDFDPTASGAKAFTKLLHVLPFPALLVDKSYRIIFVNKSCRKIEASFGGIKGSPFSSLFPDQEEALKAQLLVEDSLLHTTPLVSLGTIGTVKHKIFVRLHFRSLKTRTGKVVLVLLEDLSAEKEKLLLIKQHEDQLEEIRNELKRQVLERTAELEETIEKLHREIAEGERREEALRESEKIYRELFEESQRSQEMYRSLLNSSPDAIVLYDMDGKTRYVNDSFTKIFGWDLAELKDRQIPYLPESERETSTSVLTELMQEGTPFSAFETKRYRKDGSEIDVSISASRYHDPEGNEAGILVILRDITERRRAEEAILQSERIKAVGEMAGGVAHNFNNVLQIVLGGAQVALTNLDEGNLAEIRKNLERIVASSKYGAETVRNLQDFARIRDAGTVDRGKVFDLSQTVERAIEVSRSWWQTSTEREGINLLFYRYLENDCLVKGNEDELFGVAVNLIRNAVEALPQGGEIKLKNVIEQTNVLLQIDDTGVGIPRADVAKAFEPFWSTKGYQATGMGLATSLGIVKRHNGKLSLVSEEGKGTTVTVRLPLARESFEEEEASPKQDLNANLNILVVDDMKHIVGMLRDGLKEVGHEVLAALSGPEALDIFDQRPVDVVICDLGMPRMNGWQVAKAIKTRCEEKGVPKTPFILLTGWGHQVDEDRKVAENGVDEVMRKPVSLARVEEVIQQVLGHAPAKTT